MFLFLSCNLINKSHIQILIVICAIHKFYLHFSHGGVRFGDFVSSKIGSLDRPFTTGVTVSVTSV